jgi:small redox-active disulfide protein 2
MKLEVLGTGCPACKRLMELVEKAAAELGVSAQIVKVSDINDIMSYGIMMLPAFAVDGKVKVAGRLPSFEELKAWINEALT